MNASDIVKAKQNKVLYKALYQPTVASSTIYSTLTAFSSVTTPGTYIPVASYTSCLTTVYNGVCNPTSVSYETLNQIRRGAVECSGAGISQQQFVGIPSTLIYSFSTVYSTFTASNNIPVTQPFSYFITSSFAPIPTGTLVCPSKMVQGCNVCASNGCSNCMLGI